MLQRKMGLSGCCISEGNHGKQVVNDLREEHER